MTYQEEIEFVKDYIKDHEDRLCMGLSVCEIDGEMVVYDGLGPMTGVNWEPLEEYYHKITSHMSWGELNRRVAKVKQKNNKQPDGVAVYLKNKQGNNSINSGKTFGEAIEAMKRGCKVTRDGWNGKNMCIWLEPATKIKSNWCTNPILKKVADDNNGEIDALGTICMLTAQKQFLVGWLATQTDILSEDWIILND